MVQTTTEGINLCFNSYLLLSTEKSDHDNLVNPKNHSVQPGTQEAKPGYQVPPFVARVQWLPQIYLPIRVPALAEEAPVPWDCSSPKVRLTTMCPLQSTTSSRCSQSPKKKHRHSSNHTRKQSYTKHTHRPCHRQTDIHTCSKTRVSLISSNPKQEDYDDDAHVLLLLLHGFS
jgi:hypothetical protein